MHSVLVVCAHPYIRRSRVNQAMRRQIDGLTGIEISDLYDLYPDFFIDVAAEQQKLLRCNTLVLQHPFFWYHMPALLKHWIDEVFTMGWAYGEGGTQLKGKQWLQAISAGGPEEAYQKTGPNHFTVPELLRPHEQTAYLCGMTPLKPLILHRSRRVTDAEIQDHAKQYRELLIQLTQGQMPPAYTTTQ